MVNGVTRSVEVSAGTIAYEDSGGNGPVVVLVHGLAMDGRQWQGVVDDLRPDYRCVLPTLPMGAHQTPMRPDADLSLRGMVGILAEFLERLDLRDVTLCFNDWCGGPVMIADGHMDRVGRLVFVSCEAFENYPPGLAGHAAWLSAKLPGGVPLMRRTLLQPSLRKLPFVFGQMSKYPVPEQLIQSWMAPLKRGEIRRDFRKYAGAAMKGKRDLLAATAALASFEGPVLVAWDSEGKMMPNEHGRRLAEAFPQGRLVEISDAYTLVPLDQPALLSSHMREFLAG
jgi:pimeloyl-ACP methyl ester carboxylesterase